MDKIYGFATLIVALAAVITPSLVAASNRKFELKMEVQKDKLLRLKDDYEYQREVFSNFLSTAGFIIAGTSEYKREYEFGSAFTKCVPYLTDDEFIVFKNLFDAVLARKEVDEHLEACSSIISKKLKYKLQEQQSLMNIKRK